MDTQWMDVEGVKPYPVFNALQGSGIKSRFTYPDNEPKAYAADGYRRNEWIVDRDVDAGQHRRPPASGRPVDRPERHARRRDRSASSARARNYFDPAGAISWDVAMSATAPNWRVALKKGDVLSTNATYDTSKASWYEVMGIMVAGITEGHVDGGVDPFTGTIDQTDYLTHGRLKENIDTNAAQAEPGAQQPDRARARGRTRTRSSIKNFFYSQGDLSRARQEGPPADGPQGQAADVRQPGRAADRALPHDHRLQGPVQPDGRHRLPAGQRQGGVRLRRARLRPDDQHRPVQRRRRDRADHGGRSTRRRAEVRTARRCPACCRSSRTAASARRRGRPRRTSTPGTYAYFCRIHPFMRGAFRVK